MEISDVTEIVNNYSEKSARKRIIILTAGMLLFFGTINYAFWQQHLKDDSKLEAILREEIKTGKKRIEKVESDNDALRKDYRDAVNPANKTLDTIKGNVKQISKILQQ